MSKPVASLTHGVGKAKLSANATTTPAAVASSKTASVNAVVSITRDAAALKIGETSKAAVPHIAAATTNRVAKLDAQAAPKPTLHKKRGLADITIHQTLGTGSFGRVHLCQIIESKQFCALKVLKKAEIVKLRQVEHTVNERAILDRLHHPFLVSMFGTFQDSQNLYFILEYIQGGELFSFLRKSVRFSNDIARFYAAEVTLAFQNLHSMNIIYRDLKPEMIAGYPPFYHDEPMKLYENILQCKPRFSTAFDANCKDLVKRLLTADLTKRFGNLKGGVDDIKSHKWFQGVDWYLLEQCKVAPPYIPSSKGAGDASNFDVYDENYSPYGGGGSDPHAEKFKDF